MLDHVSLTTTRSAERITLLQDVSLSIREGEWLAVVGTNGSGKSTLAKVLAGLVPVSAGNVSCHAAGHPPLQLVLQNPDTQIIGETVYEDICFGLANCGISSSEMRQRTESALEQVGLAAFADRPAAHLSGGQKQLLAIAGCLALQPPILIFDEATSMLDPMFRQSILHIARTLHRNGETIVWITQLLDELAFADRVVALDQGQIVFAGSRQDFFYGAAGEAESMCARLGFVPPYTVRVALALLQRGLRLHPLPVSPEELGKAVGTQ